MVIWGVEMQLWIVGIFAYFAKEGQSVGESGGGWGCWPIFQRKESSGRE